MLSQIALVWSGGAVATAFAVTGSAIVGVPTRLGLGLLLLLFWPVALPWMCWQLTQQKRAAALLKQQAYTLSGGDSQMQVQGPASWDDTEKRILEQLGIRVPADIDEQVTRETGELSRIFVEYRSVTQTHPFATARALLSIAHVFILSECENKLRDVLQPVPEGYARKLATSILLTHARRFGKEHWR